MRSWFRASHTDLGYVLSIHTFPSLYVCPLSVVIMTFVEAVLLLLGDF